MHVNAATTCEVLSLLLPGQNFFVAPAKGLPEVYKDTMETPKYPGAVGDKFAVNGSVLPFAGNTIICHLPDESALMEPLLAMYAEFEKSDLSSLHTLLPPSSWHMTVFEGICDKRRNPKLWPSDLDLSASMDECNNFFEERLKNFDLGFEPPFRMSVVGFRSLKDGVSLELKPVNDATKTQLRGLRDRLSQTLTLRQPKHATYQFHLSISYSIRFLTDTQTAKFMEILDKWRDKLPDEIELHAPEFCVFEDMFAYRRRFFLGPAKMN